MVYSHLMLDPSSPDSLKISSPDLIRGRGRLRRVAPPRDAQVAPQASTSGAQASTSGAQTSTSRASRSNKRRRLQSPARVLPSGEYVIPDTDPDDPASASSSSN